MTAQARIARAREAIRQRIAAARAAVVARQLAELRANLP